MIYISVALYMEAKPFIEKFKLKRILTESNFQIFENEKIKLIITGSGKVESAISSTYLLALFPPKKSDFFLNFGIAGGNKEFSVGDIFLINKIRDDDTKKEFYPDMIFNHNFIENEITTFSLVQKEISSNLVDMEASSQFLTAKKFFNTSNIFFIKLISDFSGMINRDEIEKLIEEKFPLIENFILSLNEDYEEKVFNLDEEKLIERVSSYLFLTETLKHDLRKLLKSYKLRNKNIHPLEDIKVKSVNKKEGKKLYEELKRKLKW